MYLTIFAAWCIVIQFLEVQIGGQVFRVVSVSVSWDNAIWGWIISNEHSWLWWSIFKDEHILKLRICRVHLSWIFCPFNEVENILDVSELLVSVCAIGSCIVQKESLELDVSPWSANLTLYLGLVWQNWKTLSSVCEVIILWVQAVSWVLNSVAVFLDQVVGRSSQSK